MFRMFCTHPHSQSQSAFFDPAEIALVACFLTLRDSLRLTEVRFSKQLVYTWVSRILLAVNPFQVRKSISASNCANC